MIILPETDSNPYYNALYLSFHSIPPMCNDFKSPGNNDVQDTFETFSPECACKTRTLPDQEWVFLYQK